MNKLYFIGLYGHKTQYQPWLMSIEPLEVVNGQVLRACELTLVMFNSIPEQIRLDPPINQWMRAETPDGQITAVYFSNDSNRIYDVLEGMRYCWDVLFASGKKGIEDGELTFTDRKTSVDYTPALDLSSE